jgi:hypothetical protein
VWVVKAELMDNYKIFKDLLDINNFKTVKVGLDTLCWDNGVDFAPEYLYEKIVEENKKIA